VHAGLITWIAHSIRSNFISRPLRQTWKGLSYSLPHTSQTATRISLKNSVRDAARRSSKCLQHRSAIEIDHSVLVWLAAGGHLHCWNDVAKNRTGAVPRRRASHPGRSGKRSNPPRDAFYGRGVTDGDAGARAFARSSSTSTSVWRTVSRTVSVR